MAFQFSPDLARFLMSDSGLQWLETAAKLPLTAHTRLSDIHTLRASLNADQASAVVEQTLLRRKGQIKFDQADQMLFVREALEQATHQQVAAYRAQRFQGFDRVADLGCGIGGDSLALAQVARSVIGFDLDPVRLTFASHNSAVYNLRDKLAFVQTNVGQLPAMFRIFDAYFADPARRNSRGTRVSNPSNYHPPLNQLIESFANQPFGVKVAPGFDYKLMSSVNEIEVVSLNGEVKEVLLWFNDLAKAGVNRRATVLPSQTTLTNVTSDDCSSGPYGRYLYEPDAALIRAGLVKQVATLLNLIQPDDNIAYLSGDVCLYNPLVKTYKIEATLPLKPKPINEYIKQHQIGSIDLKQRGTGIKLEEFAHRIRATKQGKKRTLILARNQNRHVAFICDHCQQ